MARTLSLIGFPRQLGETHCGETCSFVFLHEPCISTENNFGALVSGPCFYLARYKVRPHHGVLDFGPNQFDLLVSTSSAILYLDGVGQFLNFSESQRPQLYHRNNNVCIE